MKIVTLYTDGACSGNPGPGGWAAILLYGDYKKELSGGERSTTNNRMELTGVIRGLEALNQPCEVELYSDSKYVIDALEKGWAKSWRSRGWVKGDKKPALNPDLWERLREMDKRAIAQFGSNPLGQFRKDWTVERLEARFAKEESLKEENDEPQHQSNGPAGADVQLFSEQSD